MRIRVIELRVELHPEGVHRFDQRGEDPVRGRQIAIGQVGE